MPLEPRVEQTSSMGLDHNKAQDQLYKEAFAASLAATEALKAQFQTFDESSALACEQLVAARKDWNNAIRLALSQQTNMATQFAIINTAIRSQGEAVQANLAHLQSIIRYDENHSQYRF